MLPISDYPTDYLASRLVESGASLDRDILADVSHGEIPVLLLSIRSPFGDDIARFRKFGDGEWLYMSHDDPIPLSPKTYIEHHAEYPLALLGNWPQAVLTEVVRLLSAP